MSAAGKDYKKDDLSVDYAQKWLKATAEKTQPNVTSGFTIFAPTDKASNRE